MDLTPFHFPSELDPLPSPCIRHQERNEELVGHGGSVPCIRKVAGSNPTRCDFQLVNIKTYQSDGDADTMQNNRECGLSWIKVNGNAVWR